MDKTESQPAPTKPQKSHKKLILVIIIVLIILGIAGGAVALMLLQNHPSTDSDDDQSSTNPLPEQISDFDLAFLQKDAAKNQLYSPLSIKYALAIDMEWVNKIQSLRDDYYVSFPYINYSSSAIYQTKNTYFGRNLDLDYSYHETITITPHNFPFHFAALPNLTTHHAIIGVLTNNPIFPDQLLNLSNYLSVSPASPENTIAPAASLVEYSRGLGTKFLPGGMDSESRFVKAVFTKQHATSPDDELPSVSQYFHILHSVDQSRGSDQTKLEPAEFEITVYTSGYNLDQGIAYYTCYDNHQISAIDMHKTDLDSAELTNFSMIATEQINYQN